MQVLLEQDQKVFSVRRGFKGIFQVRDHFGSVCREKSGEELMSRGKTQMYKIIKKKTMFLAKQFNAEGVFCEGTITNKVQVVEDGNQELLLQIKDGPSIRSF